MNSMQEKAETKISKYFESPDHERLLSVTYQFFNEDRKKRDLIEAVIDDAFNKVAEIMNS